MIGLGSNRLTIARRGGMSVTQAGKGGMEWLAGGRRPDWVTPYSAQATAALKAQFPTQWPTIRDYGFAHPALVPFINEDPMLVCSLMELGKIRYLVSDGASYIDSELSASSQHILYVKSYSNTANISLIGARDANYSNRASIGWTGTNGAMLDSYNNRVTVQTTAGLHEIIMNLSTKKAKIDNGSDISITSGTTITSKKYYVMAINDNGTVSYWGATGGMLAEAYVAQSSDGALLRDFVPFVSTSRNGMLDIHDLEHPVFHENKGTGTFGTEITDSPS